jgi:hypothetical protein
MSREILGYIIKEVRVRREALPERPIVFCMSSYLLDGICTCLSFLSMKLRWSPTHPPIHIFFSELG